MLGNTKPHVHGRQGWQCMIMRLLCVSIFLSLLLPVGCIYPDPDFEVTISHHDPFQTYPGTTYVTTNFVYYAFFRIEMDGEMPWVWDDLPVPVAFDMLSDGGDLIALEGPGDPAVYDSETGIPISRYSPSYGDGHHSIIETPWNTIMYIFAETIEPDYPPWGDCVLIVDGVPQEGDLLWEWRLADHVNPVEVHAPGTCLLGPFSDWVHANTVKAYQGYTLGSQHHDQVVLFNARNLSTFYLVNYPSGEIIWSCGAHGTFGQTPPFEPPLFFETHEVDMIENGNILMFDNRQFGDVSRALELRIDPLAGIAEEVWSWTDPDVVMWSGCCGDANRLPNGNTLIVSPQDANTIEVTPNGDKVWQMNIRHKGFPEGPENPVSMYQAKRVAY